jgi:hypothetical protein
VEGFTGGELLFEGVRDSPSEKGNYSVGGGREKFHMAHSPGVGVLHVVGTDIYVYCPPRHRMACNSINGDSKRVG